VKLYLLDGGRIDADRSVVHPGDDSRRRVTLPCMQVLVEHDGKHVLVDTGLPLAAAGDEDGLRREYGMDRNWIRPLMAPHQRVDEQLRSLGVEPSDLDLVINTHFHFDHAGGNALFEGVLIAAQETELAAGHTGGYLPIWDARGLQFRSVDGDWSPLPGLEMLHTPGHTPGHQSMLVRIAGRQPWLFTWDAVYTEEHWLADKLGAVVDIPAARTSIERLHRIADEENARVIFGHDIVQWEALGMIGGRPKLVAEDLTTQRS
jgi:N-acyl homoserine lactone hydrolase